MRPQTNKQFVDISSVKSKDGTVLTDPKSVNATFTSFYEELCSSEIGFDKSACESFLNDIRMEHLSDSKTEELNAPVMLHEIERVVKDMHKGKSPGPDGIPPESYLAFWPLLGPLLVDMIQFSIVE